MYQDYQLVYEIPFTNERTATLAAKNTQDRTHDSSFKIPKLNFFLNVCNDDKSAFSNMCSFGWHKMHTHYFWGSGECVSENRLRRSIDSLFFFFLSKKTHEKKC